MVDRGRLGIPHCQCGIPSLPRSTTVLRACGALRRFPKALAEGFARAYWGYVGYMLGVWAPPASNASTNIDPTSTPPRLKLASAITACQRMGPCKPSLRKYLHICYIWPKCTNCFHTVFSVVSFSIYKYDFVTIFRKCETYIVTPRIYTHRSI